jgi:nucleotide-binding universal stress UspA family protein
MLTAKLIKISYSLDVSLYLNKISSTSLKLLLKHLNRNIFKNYLNSGFLMRVLIPTDFSDNAFQSLHYVLQLMQNTQCQFILLHTYEIPASSAGEIITVNDLLKASAEKKLLELKTYAESISPPNLHRFSCLALHGDFIRVINRFSQEEKIDLMAINVTNKCFPDKTSHKGYAKKIIENSKIPLLVIPDCFQAENKVDLEQISLK